MNDWFGWLGWILGGVGLAWGFVLCRSKRGRSPADISSSNPSIHSPVQEESKEASPSPLPPLFLEFVERLQDGVLVLDEKGRILFVNATLRRLFQDPKLSLGESLEYSAALRPIRPLWEKPESSGPQTLTLQLPDLSHRVVEVQRVPFEYHQRRYSLFLFHDITRLEKLERMREEFVANVSHELRSPLTIIKGYVETLQDGALQDPEIAPRFLEKISRHVQRLEFLIQDLLTLTQLESGQLTLQFQPVRLREAADRAISDLSEKATQRQITITNLIREEWVVRADPDRLHQVLINLLDNAIKYGREAGHIILGARAKGNQSVEAWVQDDGPGIPSYALERVFERFYRVDKARSREQGGTGLGLSIVKHIIQAHGGQVSVQSQLGKGTTFFFTLPLQNAFEQKASESDVENLSSPQS